MAQLEAKQKQNDKEIQLFKKNQLFAIEQEK